MELSNKVVASAGTGVSAGTAVSFLVVWALNKYAHAGIEAEAATAMGAIISPLVGAIGGYITPHSTPPPPPPEVP